MSFAIKGGEVDGELMSTGDVLFLAKTNSTGGDVVGNHSAANDYWFGKVTSGGFAPTLEVCARDGAPVPPTGALAFSARDGGALCAACAVGHAATRLPADARQGLADLLAPGAPLPDFDPPHAAAHRRLLARYVQYHLAEGAELPALRFWERDARALA